MLLKFSSISNVDSKRHRICVMLVLGSILQCCETWKENRYCVQFRSPLNVLHYKKRDFYQFSFFFKGIPGWIFTTDLLMVKKNIHHKYVNTLDTWKFFHSSHCFVSKLHILLILAWRL